MDWKQDILRNGGSVSILGITQAWLFNPATSLLLSYRIAQKLRHKNIFGRIISRILWRLNVLSSGCYISLEANIAPGLRLPHPTGIVIGDGAKIGSGVTIFQHVTIGVQNAKAFSYPIIGDGAILYAGATVIGGIRVGQCAQIGANAVVITDIPDGGVAVGIPARIINQKS